MNQIPAHELAEYVKGATLVASRAVALENEKAAAEKAAAEERAGLVDSLLARGIILPEQKTAAEKHLATHAGAILMVKWAAQELEDARKNEKAASLMSLGTPSATVASAPAGSQPAAMTKEALAAAQRAIMAGIHDDPN